MLDIGGQLCTKMFMIIANLVMHVQKIYIGNSKSCKVGHKSSRGTIYEMGA
jgi:hypothetical protein